MITAVAAYSGLDERSHSMTNIITAEFFAQVVLPNPPGANGNITILEGPTFGPDGNLYLVHPPVSPGQPKVITLGMYCNNSAFLV